MFDCEYPEEQVGVHCSVASLINVPKLPRRLAGCLPTRHPAVEDFQGFKNPRSRQFSFCLALLLQARSNIGLRFIGFKENTRTKQAPVILLRRMKRAEKPLCQTQSRPTQSLPQRQHAQWKGLGEKKFRSKFLSSSLILNFLPIPHRKRPPQTPQMLSQNQTRVSAVSDLGTETKPSRNLARELEKSRVFQLIFLSDDENQGVEVKEVDEINFTEVKMRVENGDSVFITKRENEKVNASSLRHRTKKKTR